MGEVVRSAVCGSVRTAEAKLLPLALRQSDCVTLQAHRASATWETRTAMAEMVLDSVNSALAGERPAMSLTT